MTTVTGGLRLRPTIEPTEHVTPYDQQLFLTYARMLHALDRGIDWWIEAEEILALDAVDDPALAERCWHSHLERARWIADNGYARLNRDY